MQRGNIFNNKDKRGLTLLQFVIDVIIGIICVVLLFYLGASIASIFFGPQENIQKAQGNLDNIMDAIEYEDTFLLQPVDGWYLISSSKDLVNKKVVLSEECENETCVCICPRKLYKKVDCSENSQCKTLEKPLLENKGLVFRQIALIEFKITEENDFYKLEEIKE